MNKDIIITCHTKEELGYTRYYILFGGDLTYFDVENDKNNQTGVREAFKLRFNLHIDCSNIYFNSKTLIEFLYEYNKILNEKLSRIAEKANYSSRVCDHLDKHIRDGIQRDKDDEYDHLY